MTNQNSKCCGSSVTAISSDEGTSYYQCNRCLQPTDVVSKCCEKCINAPKCKHGCVLRHFHCENCPCHTTSKSEEKQVGAQDKVQVGYNTSQCCGANLFQSQDFMTGRFSGYICSNCLKPANSLEIPNSSPRLENWEERFDEKYKVGNTTYSIDTVHSLNSADIAPLKSFISTLLQEERGKFINEIDETLKTVGDFSGGGIVSEDMKNFARIALNDLKVKIQQQ